MIYRSRDYSFSGLRDHRFTQYQCQVCQSYRVSIISVVNWPDASANVAVGEGEMKCLDCSNSEKGKVFQVLTASHHDESLLLEMLTRRKEDTGDTWS